MSGSPSPRVAFFGATGGCTLACLVHTLRAGIPSVALVRNPSKLIALLQSQALSESTISSTLTIVQGNAHDLAAVKSTIMPSSSTGTLPELIISGLGAAPSFSFNWRHPLQLFTLDDEHVCENAAKTLITALQQAYAERPALKAHMPLISFISTTGITRGPEDVPFLMRFLYHQLLATPHVDKKNMEDLFRDNVDAKDGQEKLFRSLVGIRPTLLSGSTDVADGVGYAKVRAGTENAPALGYTIKRADVGEWIFRNVVESAEGRKGWEGQMVSLTS